MAEWARSYARQVVYDMWRDSPYYEENHKKEWDDLPRDFEKMKSFVDRYAKAGRFLMYMLRDVLSRPRLPSDENDMFVRHIFYTLDGERRVFATAELLFFESPTGTSLRESVQDGERGVFNTIHEECRAYNRYLGADYIRYQYVPMTYHTFLIMAAVRNPFVNNDNDEQHWESVWNWLTKCGIRYDPKEGGKLLLEMAITYRRVAPVRMFIGFIGKCTPEWDKVVNDALDRPKHVGAVHTKEFDKVLRDWRSPSAHGPMCCKCGVNCRP